MVQAALGKHTTTSNSSSTLAVTVLVTVVVMVVQAALDKQPDDRLLHEVRVVAFSRPAQ